MEDAFEDPPLRVSGLQTATEPPSLEPAFRRAATVLAALAVALGAVVLAGWLLGIEHLKSLSPRFGTMKANTAVAFILIGAGAYLAREDRRDTASRACGALVFAISMATLGEYVLDASFGIDELLLSDAGAAHAPGRMPPATAVAFALLGMALALGWLRMRLRSVATSAAAVIALVSLCGYAFQASSLYQLGTYSFMAAHTAVGLVIAAGAVAFARPDRGWVAILASTTTTGAMMRWLLPVIVAVPIVLGWLLSRAQHAGALAPSTGIALLTASSIVLLAIIASVIAGTLHRADERRRRADEAVGDRERDLATLLASIGEAVVATDARGRITRLNPVAEHLTGWPEDLARARPLGEVFRLVHESTRAALDSPLVRLRRGSHALRSTAEAVLVSRHGSEHPIGGSVAPMLGARGAVEGAVLVFRDVSRERADLRDQQLLVSLGDQLRIADDPEAIFYGVARQLGEHLGAARCSFAEIDTPGDRALIHRQFVATGVRPLPDAVQLSAFSPATNAEARAGRSVVIDDVEIDPRTAPYYEGSYGQSAIRSVLAVPVRRGSEWIATLSVTSEVRRVWEPREITLVQLVAERTWAWIEHLRAVAETLELNARLEERVVTRTAELAERVRERDTLLQEIHHRVKNNLQVVSSLIHMQLRKLAEPAGKAALEECARRVSAIALIHEQLYQSPDYGRVPFSEYARTLATNIFHASGLSPGAVSLHVEIDDLALPVDKAIPCGLILNELITNALKHAFPDERTGNLRVELRRTAPGQLQLVVADDGKGIPAGVEPRRSRSLGMQLVATLTAQLDGTCEMRREGGTSFRITFPLEEVPAAEEPPRAASSQVPDFARASQPIARC